MPIPNGQHCEASSCSNPASISQPVGVYDPATDSFNPVDVFLCGTDHDLSLGIPVKELPARVRQHEAPPKPMKELPREVAEE